jgi:hypothetical protein
MKKPLLDVLAIVISTFSFSGCAPAPRLIPRTDAVQGRIVDSQSHTPISGATVKTRDSDTPIVKTDENGVFHYPKIHSFRFFYDFQSSPDRDASYPRDTYYIQKRGYTPANFMSFGRDEEHGIFPAGEIKLYKGDQDHYFYISFKGKSVAYKRMHNTEDSKY